MYNIYTLFKFFANIRNRSFMMLGFINKIGFELYESIHIPSSVFQDFSHD